ncbi:hypothetical protein BC833DRAFT_584404 [Globomyces pollinis-pini]|nr:hypothetical protein BC833DRAFT_584404 [Globomyces pollinis-pini]
MNQRKRGTTPHNLASISTSNNQSHTAQRMPQRTTKITQKLVLLPDDGPNNEESLPLSPEESAQSKAERLKKSDRSDIPRVTSYCLAESFNFEDISKYVRFSHGIATKQYDECLHFSYDGVVKERMFGVPSPQIMEYPMLVSHSHTPQNLSPRSRSLEGAIFANFPDSILVNNEAYTEDSQGAVKVDEQSKVWMSKGDVYIFEYGVMVLWNFTEQEEKSFIGHMKPYGNKWMAYHETQIEDFNFQYDLSGPFQPRIFNDMITLKSGSPLIKLTISHGLAQSVKLSIFEIMMEETIEGAVPLSKMMAEFGTVKMTRINIMKIVGNLYKLKMNVNLISNVLDTPEIFWSEPGLESLYTAIRGYLEISQRAHLLNTRADVLSDLLSMLSDHINSSEMTYITWIIIVLIFIAAVIAGAEVFVKVIRLRAGLDD